MAVTIPMRIRGWTFRLAPIVEGLKATISHTGIFVKGVPPIGIDTFKRVVCRKLFFHHTNRKNTVLT